MKQKQNIFKKNQEQSFLAAILFNMCTSFKGINYPKERNKLNLELMQYTLKENSLILL